MESSGQRKYCRRRYRLPRGLSRRALPLAGIVVFTAASWSFAQERSPETQIRAVLDEQVAAWNRGDIDGYMRGYWDSDSTEFVSGGSLTKGYAGVLSRYKKSYNSAEKMGTLEFRELNVRLLSPATAVASGVWSLTRTSDKPWGRFTLIVELKPEGWRITRDHTSSAQ